MRGIVYFLLHLAIQAPTKSLLIGGLALTLRVLLVFHPAGVTIKVADMRGSN